MSFFKRLTKSESEAREAEAQEEIEAIQTRLLSRPYVYRPERTSWWSTPTEKKSLADQYIDALEDEGDMEEVTKKFLRKILRQPAATKPRAVSYLDRAIKKAQEEGRL